MANKYCNLSPVLIPTREDAAACGWYNGRISFIVLMVIFTILVIVYVYFLSRGKKDSENWWFKPGSIWRRIINGFVVLLVIGAVVLICVAPSLYAKAAGRRWEQAQVEIDRTSEALGISREESLRRYFDSRQQIAVASAQNREAGSNIANGLVLASLLSRR
jgi:hypothetical protein